MTIVDLAGLVLELSVWGAPVASLRFLDPPPAAALAEGRALLVALGALDEATGRPTATGRRMADLPVHPRLARMVTDATALGRGGVACALAALLEDRDILGGRPGEVGVDVAERVRLIAGAGAGEGFGVDRAGLAAARRRAGRLRLRAGIPSGPVDARDCGRVLALAYPDRLAQSRGRGRFRLRNGTGAWLAESDPLSGEAFLVVAQLDPDSGDNRIRLAAALDPADLEQAAGSAALTVTSVAWDPERDDLRATVTRTIDGLVLATTERKAQAGPDTTAALVDHVRASRLAALTWTDAARSLQRRVAFLRRTFGDDWPDLSDEALVADLEEWLTPRLANAVGRAGIEAVDVTASLRARLPHRRLAELEVLAPTSVPIAASRRLRVDYGTDPPSAAARIQDLFRVATHPTIAGGRIPLVLHLLSPAGRPVQVTADLPGFWAGSYAAVRKEMAGRYPKHRWPLDPQAP